MVAWREDGGVREDKDVGDAGGEVGEDDEGHGSVDDAGEVAGWVEEFAHDVVGVVPAVKGPEAGVDGDGPVGGVGACAVEPVGRCPVFGWWAFFPAEACGCDDDARDGYAEEGDEFEEHEDVAHASGELRRDTVEDGHCREAC